MLRPDLIRSRHDKNGIAVDTELAAVARSARASGVALVAADVLADRDAPAVARQRALGMVALDLAAFQAGQPLQAAVA